MISDKSTQFLPTSGKLPASERGRDREAAILRVATRHFLNKGYGDTKLDAIAKEAGGSKSTLYKFFPSKTDLFYAVVAGVVADRRRIKLDPDQDIYDCLVEFSLDRLRVVFTKRHWSLMRLIMAERDRFPRIARAYYDVGPKNSHEVLANYLRNLAERNLLNIEDPDQAAHFFIGMLMHEWYLMRLLVLQNIPSDSEKHERARSVVSAFLGMYKPAGLSGAV
jgi:AcrR family transcriptional regulator